MNEQQKLFLEKVTKASKDNWTKAKILPSISIAQALLESDWGRSDLAVHANNLFGVKGDFKGFGYLKNSTEIVNGKEVKVASWFKNYPSWEASMEDHLQTFVGSEWRKNTYKDAIGEADYRKVAKALTGVYATDPAYGDKLVSIIKGYSLDKYDPKIIPEPVFAHKVRIGDYISKEHATLVLNLLKGGGIPDAWMITVGNVYRIQVGAFETRKEADERLGLVNKILPKISITIEK